MEIIELSQNQFKEEVLNNKEKILVDFNADWCGPCKMIEPILEEIAKENKIKIISINVDNNQDLAIKYQISSVPCLILFKNGQEIKRNIGLISKREINEFIGE